MSALNIPESAAVIIRTAKNTILDQILNPISGHEPKWIDVDCPSCGSAPCGPHPDVLVCKGCEDDYPCQVVRAVAAELERMANTPFEDGPWWALATSLRERVAELRGESS